MTEGCLTTKHLNNEAFHITLMNVSEVLFALTLTFV